MSNATGSWQPTATHDALVARARVLACIRRFFEKRDVLEVETPALSRAATTDPHLSIFSTHYVGPGLPAATPLYLHTSPEFAMKRLLAAGFGSLYQICRVFRDGEAGRLHNPEFTLLEWYRVGFDHLRLAEEVVALIHEVLADIIPLAPAQYLTYQDAFVRHCGVDPLAADLEQLRAHASTLNAPAHLGEDRDAWLDLLLTHLVEPQLGRGRLTVLCDYPASQAALARVRPGPPAVAERFEVYLEGIELANGFHELGDAEEQRRRFTRDNSVRAAKGLPVMPHDERLLQALQHGLPDCAGVALGVDRLVMLRTGAKSIKEVITFPVDRA